MKLYIPTSSLNADSILSCECVAPARECSKRAFGYSHFEILEELRQYDYCTLAFTKVPQFNIYDPTRENYPMVVEIEADNPEGYGLSHIGIFDGIAVYASANPIIISPSNTNLLFCRKQDLEYTFNSCSDSAKCKFFDFFKSHFHGVGYAEQGPTLSELLREISVPKLESTYSENAYDKAKGFIWGYALGLVYSLSPEIAKLLKIQKRVYDIISSIKSDGNIPDSLKLELETLDNEYSIYDPIPLIAKNRWNEKISILTTVFSELPNGIPTAILDKILRELGVENEAKSRFLADEGISLRKSLRSYSLTGTYGYDQYNQELRLHTQACIARNRKEILNGTLFQDQLAVNTSSFESVTLTVESEDNRLFNNIAKQIIWDDLIPSLEEIRINRKDVAVTVVKTLRSIIEGLGQQWQDSDIQAYFDRMRKNISKYEPFELMDIDNPVLQSVAAFILKGEDYDSLKSYLETNAVPQYQYALALWGGLVGYVSIPRTIFDGLSRDIVVSIYSQVEKILDRIDLPLSLPAEGPQETYTEPIEVTTFESSQKMHSQIRNFRQQVLEYFHKVVKKNKRNKDLLEEGLLLALDKFGDDNDPLRFVSLLNDFRKYGWSETLKPWKQMCEHICPDYSIQTYPTASRVNRNTIDAHPIQNKMTCLHGSEINTTFSHRESLGGFGKIVKGVLDLFSSTDNINSETESKLATKNESLRTHNESLLNSEVLENMVFRHFPNLHKQVSIDIRWFVGNYASTYRDERSGKITPGRYANSPKDNLSVLDKFANYLHNKQESSQEWLRKIYYNVPVEQILSLLYSKYGNR